MLALGALALGLLSSCAASFDPDEWASQVALEVPGAKLGGCAVGDLIDERDGSEIAVAAADGSVFYVHRGEDGTWQHERVWRAPGEIVQCAIGELDGEAAGDEFVGVGMRDGGEDSGGPGAVYLIARSDDGWRAAPIHEEGSLVHGLAITGGALWVAGFDRRLSRLQRGADGTWTPDVALDLPGAGKNVLALSPERIVVACDDGSLVQAVTRQSGEWTLQMLHERPGIGRARLASDGARILCADDDGALFLIRPGQPIERFATRLHEEAGKLRGAVLADLADREGLEAACAGYSGQVTMLLQPRDGRPDEGVWQDHALLRDAGRLHHLAAGEVDGRPGLELVTCGFAGKLYVLTHLAEP